MRHVTTALLSDVIRCCACHSAPRRRACSPARRASPRAAAASAAASSDASASARAPAARAAASAPAARATSAARASSSAAMRACSTGLGSHPGGPARPWPATLLQRTGRCPPPPARHACKTLIKRMPCAAYGSGMPAAHTVQQPHGVCRSHNMRSADRCKHSSKLLTPPRGRPIARPLGHLIYLVQQLRQQTPTTQQAPAAVVQRSGPGSAGTPGPSQGPAVRPCSPRGCWHAWPLRRHHRAARRRRRRAPAPGRARRRRPRRAPPARRAAGLRPASRCTRWQPRRHGRHGVERRRRVREAGCQVSGSGA
jgi:hypothetical protein